MGAQIRRALFWLGLMSPALIPFLCPYLPFQDWPAHAGVVGAMVHASDPESRILEFYTYAGWFKMNALFYVPAYLLAYVMSPLSAVNLTLAASLGSVGPSMAYLCKSVGADKRWAWLAVPIALGRNTYCGFGPNVAALSLFLLAFGAYFSLRAHPRWRIVMGLGLLLAALGFMHAFVYLAGAGLMLLALLIDAVWPPRRAAGYAAIAWGVSMLWFVFLFTRGLGVAGQAQGSAVDAVWTAIENEPRQDLPKVFWEWLFASYRYSKVDDYLQAAWAVIAGGSAMLGLALGSPKFRKNALILVGLSAVTLFMFWLLPANVGAPVNWWGARLRLPVMVVLLLIPVAGPRRSLPWLAVPSLAGVVALGTVGWFGWDLYRFDQTEMVGFAEVLGRAPKGHRVQFLHYTPRKVNEYPGVPYGYFGNYYMLEKGGSVGQDFFQRNEYPFLRKQSLAGPGWAMAHGFRWSAHGPGYDGFLIRRHPTREHAPFSETDLQERVELVHAAGNWRYYRTR